jgi:hypothetical protein
VSPQTHNGQQQLAEQAPPSYTSSSSIGQRSFCRLKKTDDIQIQQLIAHGTRNLKISEKLTDKLITNSGNLVEDVFKSTAVMAKSGFFGLKRLLEHTGR